jgi:hypothetical protein
VTRSLPNVYSPRTLAQEWGCSEQHIRNLIRDGQLRGWRAGGIVSDDFGESSVPSTTTPENVTAIRLARIQR